MAGRSISAHYPAEPPMKTYTYFSWCPTGAHVKVVVFTCSAASITDADAMASAAGIAYLKFHVCWT